LGKVALGSTPDTFLPLYSPPKRIDFGDIYGTLREIVASMKRGRENDAEITIFDSTGLAIQDIICAKLVYNKAKERGL